MFILNRYYKFYKYNGLIKTITKILTTPYRIVKKYIYQKNKEKPAQAGFFNSEPLSQTIERKMKKKPRAALP